MCFYVCIYVFITVRAVAVTVYSVSISAHIYSPLWVVVVEGGLCILIFSGSGWLGSTTSQCKFPFGGEGAWRCSTTPPSPSELCSQTKTDIYDTVRSLAPFRSNGG